MAVTDTHEEKETLAVDVLLPGHQARETTALFTHSKKLLIEREGGRCFICNATAEESGHPLEAHHHPIERSLANLINWELVAAQAKGGEFGARAAAFDWDGFFKDAKVVTAPAVEGKPLAQYLVPADPYLFVDDMTVNGLLLCKEHHTGKDAGIHDMPFPLWIAQRFAIEGYQFTPTQIIHHQDQS
ncbi:hypothetical protein M3795_16980 [Ralstonia pickettii]|uniref:hypothetical protein n=1 Tax=Ralstonia pickettii TaxID=329 RepID=UPI00203CE55F|nr:hypothetical protein [Ralstonia pickettii]MCM3582179.1 hypothetical protein [Ralstonia pickettii]